MDMGSHHILNIMEDGDPRRSSRRRRVFLSARLATPAGEYPVQIRDISATGARVEGADLPRANSNVVLKRGAFTGFGRLVWVDGGVGGLEFDEPLEEDELLESLKGIPAAAPAQQPYRRPGLNRGGHKRLSDGRGWVDAPPAD
jgi:hypothetical protein